MGSFIWLGGLTEGYELFLRDVVPGQVHGHVTSAYFVVHVHAEVAMFVKPAPDLKVFEVLEFRHGLVYHHESILLWMPRFSEISSEDVLRCSFLHEDEPCPSRSLDEFLAQLLDVSEVGDSLFRRGHSTVALLPHVWRALEFLRYKIQLGELCQGHLIGTIQCFIETVRHVLRGQLRVPPVGRRGGHHARVLEQLVGRSGPFRGTPLLSTMWMGVLRHVHQSAALPDVAYSHAFAVADSCRRRAVIAAIVGRA